MAQRIDTSVFVAMERRGLGLGDLAGAAPDEAIALAAITASELLAGVHRAKSKRIRLGRERFVEALLDAIPVLEFDLRAARLHSRLWFELDRHGQRIGAHDLLIAATATAHGSAVLTENVREFGRVPGLEVRTPRWDSEPR